MGTIQAPEEITQWGPLRKEWRARKMELDRKTRAILWIPRAQQDSVKILDPSNTPPRQLNQGCAIVQAYTDIALMPEMWIAVLESLENGREGHSNKVITCVATTDASVFAHEITHATEQQTKTVLEASLNFLKGRRKRHIYKGQEILEPARKLKEITGENYKDDEIAYEDHWVERGGTAYSGKVYPNERATEILTTGIERLHADPLLFLRTDPDYFLFVVHTLRGW